MADHRVDVLDLPEEAREIVRESEITGGRTFVTRTGREVAVVISHDEYVALRETIAIGGDDVLRARLTGADAEAARGSMLLPEDLFATEGTFGNDRLRVSESAWGTFVDEQLLRVREAFTEIDANPLVGSPLFPPLRPWWSYRGRDLRIVYRVAAEGRFVAVLGIDFDRA